jgi:hypothetical protein
MNPSDRNFSQAVTSRLSGVSVDVIRDWRKRDILGMGEQTETGRWVYSLEEILRFSIVRLIEGCGQPVRTMLYMSERLSLFVLARFSDEPHLLAFKRDQAKFPLAMNGEVSPRFSTIAPPDDLEAIIAEHPLVIEVNIARLIDWLPAEVKNLLDDSEAA